MNCVFCILPEIREREIASNELAWCFLTNIPIVPGHTLIVPKRCVPLFDDLTPAELVAINELRTKVVGALKKQFGAEGFNYAWNDGKVAGQSVPHFHLHVLPRKKDDTGVHGYEPRQFVYRPGSRSPSPEVELQEVTALIRSAL